MMRFKKDAIWDEHVYHFMMLPGLLDLIGKMMNLNITKYLEPDFLIIEETL